MKQFFFGVFACALCATTLALADDADDTNGSGGLDRMLHTAHVGVSFTEFAAAHPEAVYSDADLRETAVSAEHPGSLLITYAVDPFLGLYAFANIGFKDAALYELVSVWTGAPEDVAARRRRFFTATIQRHGPSYTRQTILVHPHTPEERPAAVFLWQDTNATTLAFYTAPSPLASYPRAALTYAQFTPGDPFLDDILYKHPPTDEQREKAWQAHEDILPWLDALE